MEGTQTVNPISSSNFKTERIDLRKGEEYDPYNDNRWWTLCGFYRRLKSGRFRQLFVSSKELTVVDVDAIVNVFALVNALILTIPVTLMSSASYSNWDVFEELAYSCQYIPDNQPGKYEPAEYIQFAFKSTANNIICSIYSTIVCLILTVIYYASRPSEQVLKKEHCYKKMPPNDEDPYDFEKAHLANYNFCRWWKRGRHLMTILFAGTGIAGISLLCSVNIFYQVFFTSSDNFCSGTRTRVFAYSFGYYLVLFVIAITFYIVI